MAPVMLERKQLASFQGDLAMTTQWAQKVAADFSTGDVVLFRGDLGAGKTTLIREICAALGYKDIVSSPTFTLINEYTGAAMPLFHFDFYRLEVEEEAIGLGLDDYLDADGLCLIEWPEKIESYLPESRYEVHLSIPDYGNQPNIRAVDFFKVIAS